jgi:LAS superfamily LD-carboxypeptidase LdcB
MKTKTIFLTAFAFFALIFSACNDEAQNSKKQTEKTVQNASKIEVIQFHSEHRCMTCKLIEKLSREALQESPEIPFKLINVDDPKNEEIAKEFQAVGTSLFLYNPISKKKKELTEFAFMNAASNPEEFKKGLIKEIKNFN